MVSPGSAADSSGRPPSGISPSSLGLSGIADWLQSKIPFYKAGREAGATSVTGSKLGSVNIRSGSNPFFDDTHAPVEEVKLEPAASTQAEARPKPGGDGPILVEDVTDEDDGVTSSSEVEEQDQDTKQESESRVSSLEEQVQELASRLSDMEPEYASQPSEDQEFVTVPGSEILSMDVDEAAGTSVHRGAYGGPWMMLILFAYAIVLVAEYYILLAVYNKYFPQHVAADHEQNKPSRDCVNTQAKSGAEMRAKYATQSRGERSFKSCIDFEADSF